MTAFIQQRLLMPLTQSKQRVAQLLWLLAALFIVSNGVAYSLIEQGRPIWAHLAGPLLWAVAHGTLFALIHRYKPEADSTIFLIVSLLAGWSLLLTDRLAPNFLTRQIVWVLLGTAVIPLLLFLPQNLGWLRRYRYTLLILGIGLMFTTFFFGVNPSGAATANYWLQLPFAIPVFFQPSELLKLLLVIFLASYFDEQETIYFNAASPRKMNTLAVIAPIAVMGGFCLLLLVWQQDLGAATLFFILFLSLFYVATGKRYTILAGLGLLLLAGAFAYWQFALVTLRVDAWLNPWPDADGRAFQIVQSLYAIASGGVFGQGIGQGFPTYIPVVHSDFVFAAIAEEWGLVGSLTVVFCFALLAHRGLLLAIRAIRPFHRYLAVGIITMLSAQALLIMGGVTKLLPLTGVTLPFVSYGGSSMMMVHVMVGLLLYLSAQPMRPEAVSHISPSQTHVRQLHLTILIGFLLVALSLFYWGTVRAGVILRREDNPRQVETALRIQRGTIVDKNGVVLAGTIGTGNNLTRRYPITDIGPAVGYYSFRHGTSGVEGGFNDELAGVDNGRFLQQQLLHRPIQGESIRLTLDTILQLKANSLMADQSGGILLLQQSPSGDDVVDILVMGSYPTYNPNLVDERFDLLIEDETAPLLNRTTLGQYQPGMMLTPFVLATAVNQQRINLQNTLPDAPTAIDIEGERLTCNPPSAQPNSWQEAIARSCPGLFTMLGETLGETQLSQAFANFGLTQPITLPLDLEETAVPPIDNPALAAIGQDTLTITPVLLGRAWVGLLNNGRLPTMRLVSHIETEAGIWVEQFVDQGEMQTAVSTTSASAIEALLPRGENGEVEVVGTAVSGPDSSNSWYLGHRAINGTNYYAIVILENSSDRDEVERVGRMLLDSIQ